MGYLFGDFVLFWHEELIFSETRGMKTYRNKYFLDFNDALIFLSTFTFGPNLMNGKCGCSTGLSGTPFSLAEGELNW